MKKFTLLIALACLIQATAISQSCLPEGIWFTTQAQIDNFQTNYPGCTMIEGDVEIGKYNNNINNLNGLNVLTSFGEGLTMRYLDSLISLTGLENLTSVGGDLKIIHVDAITNLSGLVGLTSIGGDLGIYSNDALTSLSGFDNLESIGGNLWIYDNYALTSLTGLDNLESIGGRLDISWNDGLTSLAGLENVTLIGGDIYIYHNDTLSTCNVQSICDYLVAPNGSVNIYNNAAGCNNPTQIAEACGITLSCLPYGNYYFLNQDEVDNFQTNYPNCTEIEGNVEIYGDDITNLDGLSNVMTIGEILQIGNNIHMTGDNPVLISLQGLSNLSTVGGDLRILGNDSLVNLSGLESLSSIGRRLVIGDWWNTWPCANLSLLSLDGLDNLAFVGDRIQIFGGVVEDISALSSLTSINGDVNIRNVPFLQSLDGLNNISSIGGNLKLSGLGLINMSGLDNLSYIAGGFGISSNDSLISMSGLTALDSIGSGLAIFSNSVLQNLTGLDNLTFIGGSLRIGFNDTLNSLLGLDNIDAFSIDYLDIYSNKFLSNCEVQSICDYLASPNGTVEIYNNAPGCNSPGEIANACGFPIPCLPFGNYYFLHQTDVDSFQVYYPGCTTLEGNVAIFGMHNSPSNIKNLNGLDVISSIEGNLRIQNTDSLINLTGLDNLILVGGSISIVDNNDVLTSLTGLDGLNSIGGDLKIVGNEALISLQGIENIYAETIQSISFRNNPSLSTCEVQSVCNYLASPQGWVNIHDNAPGCNSRQEVEEACEGSCLPDGINFTSQAQIDSFAINYPNCTEIEGEVKIYGEDITNLSGLSMLSSIEGKLQVGSGWVSNAMLQNLTGLNNLTSIGGNLDIQANPVLKNLTGLENLTSIGGDIKIGNENWKSSDSKISSSGNPCLKNLTGLDNLLSVGGGLQTQRNDSLTSFAGLENIDSIEGIYTTDPITTLSDLDNLYFIGNDGLKLKNTALSSLAGLENVTQIEGDIYIDGNDSLTSLAGLENLVSIHGDLFIGGWILRGSGNPILISLEGLGNLAFIGGNLFIDRNAALTSLTGLEKLTSVEGGKIVIGYDHQWWGNGGNTSLISLSGLDNIDGNSITDLVIINNTSLNTCDVESICDYLAGPNATVEIHDNAPGCNSPEEVEMACDSANSVHESNIIQEVSVHPNPFSASTIIEYKLPNPEKVTITIYNHLGKQIYMIANEHQPQGKHEVRWNTKGLPAGVYFCVLKTDTGIQTLKMIKLK